MKKPNPHFMDRKVKYVKKSRKTDEPENQKQDNDQKPKQKLSRKQRINEKRKEKIELLKEKKKQLTAQLSVAQNSTKSMGKFDRKAHQEERKIKVKRRKQHATFKSLEDEVNRNMEVLGMVRTANGSKKVSHSL